MKNWRNRVSFCCLKCFQYGPIRFRTSVRIYPVDTGRKLNVCKTLIIFFLPLNSICFSNCQLMNLVDSKRTETLQKIDCFCYFWDNFFYIAFFSLIKCLTWLFIQGGSLSWNVRVLWGMKFESIFLIVLLYFVLLCFVIYLNWGKTFPKEIHWWPSWYDLYSLL